MCTLNASSSQRPLQDLIDHVWMAGQTPSSSARSSTLKDIDIQPHPPTFAPNEHPHSNEGANIPFPRRQHPSGAAGRGTGLHGDDGTLEHAFRDFGARGFESREYEESLRSRLQNDISQGWSDEAFTDAWDRHSSVQDMTTQQQRNLSRPPPPASSSHMDMVDDFLRNNASSSSVSPITSPSQNDSISEKSSVGTDDLFATDVYNIEEAADLYWNMQQSRAQSSWNWDVMFRSEVLKETRARDPSTLREVSKQRMDLLLRHLNAGGSSP